MPVDVCGAFTLEQLDMFGNLDQLPFSLDDPIWESPNTCVLYGDAAVSANAEVNAVASRIKFFAAVINGDASVSASAIRVISGIASITANSQVEVSAARVRTADASVISEAIVSALGGVEYSAFASVNAEAIVVCLPSTVFSSSANVNAQAIFSAIGGIIGEEWSDSDFSPTSWQNVVPGSDSWTPISQSSQTWLRQL